MAIYIDEFAKDMNADKLTTLAGLIAAITASLSTTGVLDPSQSKVAAIVSSVALGVLGFYTNKR